ncbi:hypothetical protein HDV05_002591 [Chytridiales sp. JEL 0842]|nr:hypothetical protein HDV05_002591 [Chytridiales sp. JEL 0842]
MMYSTTAASTEFLERSEAVVNHVSQVGSVVSGGPVSQPAGRSLNLALSTERRKMGKVKRSKKMQFYNRSGLKVSERSRIVVVGVTSSSSPSVSSIPMDVVPTAPPTINRRHRGSTPPLPSWHDNSQDPIIHPPESFSYPPGNPYATSPILILIDDEQERAEEARLTALREAAFKKAAEAERQTMNALITPPSPPPPPSSSSPSFPFIENPLPSPPLSTCV